MMKTYKCTNCEHTWESEEMPFECPKCHSATISQIGGNKNDLGATFKKYWWIIVAAVVAALVLILALPNGATRVKVKTDTETGRMEVTVKGKHASEYAVILEQNGYVERQGSTADNNPVIFDDLMGDYTLKLIYSGSGDIPKIHKFKTDYSFDRSNNNVEESDYKDDETIVDIFDDNIIVAKTDKPEIIKVETHPDRVKQGGKYSVTIRLSKHGCQVSDAEFSMDGLKYQSSNVFDNLEPGEYKFYVRNKEAGKQNLVDEKGITLQEGYSDNCPSVDDINSLLPKVAQRDREATAKLFKLVSRETKIEGAGVISDMLGLSRELVSDQSMTYKVVSIDCSGGKVNSVTVKKL